MRDGGTAACAAGHNHLRILLCLSECLCREWEPWGPKARGIPLIWPWPKAPNSVAEDKMLNAISQSDPLRFAHLCARPRATLQHNSITVGVKHATRRAQRVWCKGPALCTLSEVY